MLIPSDVDCILGGIFGAALFLIVAHGLRAFMDWVDRR